MHSSVEASWLAEKPDPLTLRTSPLASPLQIGFPLTQVPAADVLIDSATAGLAAAPARTDAPRSALPTANIDTAATVRRRDFASPIATCPPCSAQVPDGTDARRSLHYGR